MWNFKRSGPPLRSDRCALCGASLRPVRISFAEMTADVVCGILLLTVVTLAGYIADKWLERSGHELFDRPVGHEPLDSWSL